MPRQYKQIHFVLGQILYINIIYTFSKEVQLFAVGRKKTFSITAVKRALLTIPPTFVEVEGVFCAAGLFFTKLRTRLGYRSIN